MQQLSSPTHSQGPQGLASASGRLPPPPQEIFQSGATRSFTVIKKDESLQAKRAARRSGGGGRSLSLEVVKFSSARLLLCMHSKGPLNESTIVMLL